MLYILQGPSGSGKSTLAKMIQSAHAKGTVSICSTDSYFYKDRTYQFDPSRLGEYHEKNLKAACLLMENGCSVIVDNTNIHCWECYGYVKYAVDHGIDVCFIRVTGSKNWKTTHGVPDAIVRRQLEEMENLTVESVLSAFGRRPASRQSP